MLMCPKCTLFVSVYYNDNIIIKKNSRRDFYEMEIKRRGIALSL